MFLRIELRNVNTPGFSQWNRKRPLNPEKIPISQIKALCEGCCKLKVIMSALAGVSHFFRIMNRGGKEGEDLHK